MFELPSQSPLLQRYLQKRPEFLRFLQARVSQPERVQEMLQDLFLKLIEKAPTGRSEQQFLAWCYQVLRHMIQDDYRHQQVKRRALTNYCSELTTQTETQEPRNPCSCMNTILPTLKPTYTQAIKKVLLQEESIDSFAIREGMTQNHTLVRLHRARNALRKRLLQHCESCAKAGCLDCTCPNISSETKSVRKEEVNRL